MTQITRTTLFSNAWESLYTLLKNNLTDPKGRFKVTIIKNQRVYPSGTGTIDYPYIVLYTPALSFIQSFNDRSIVEHQYQYPIEILTTDPAQNDTISNQVISIINLEANWESLRASGLNNIKVIDSPFQQTDIDGKQIFIRTMQIKATARVSN